MQDLKIIIDNYHKDLQGISLNWKNSWTTEREASSRNFFLIWVRNGKLLLNALSANKYNWLTVSGEPLARMRKLKLQEDDKNPASTSHSPWSRVHRREPNRHVTSVLTSKNSKFWFGIFTGRLESLMLESDSEAARAKCNTRSFFKDMKQQLIQNKPPIQPDFTHPYSIPLQKTSNISIRFKWDNYANSIHVFRP